MSEIDWPTYAELDTSATGAQSTEVAATPADRIAELEPTVAEDHHGYFM